MATTSFLKPSYNALFVCSLVGTRAPTK